MSGHTQNGNVIQDGKPTNRPLHFRNLSFDEGAPAQMRMPTGQIAQFLHQGDVLIVGTLIPGKKPDAPGIRSPVHRHPCDQVLIAAEGEIAVTVEGKDLRIPAGAALLLPAGTPHTTGNEGSASAVLIEILSPAPASFAPPLLPEDAQFDRKGRQAVLASPGQLEPSAESGGHVLRDMLLDPERGSQNAIIYAAESKASKPQLHMQTFDQYFFVLEGVLTVQLGVEEFDVGARTLVKVPAGIAHTQWNSKGTRERHLVIIAPLPVSGAGECSDVVIKMEAHPQRKLGSSAIY